MRTVSRWVRAVAYCVMVLAASLPGALVLVAGWLRVSVVVHREGAVDG